MEVITRKCPERTPQWSCMAVLLRVSRVTAEVLHAVHAENEL